MASEAEVLLCQSQRPRLIFGLEGGDCTYCLLREPTEFLLITFGVEKPAPERFFYTQLSNSWRVELQ